MRRGLPVPAGRRRGVPAHGAHHARPRVRRERVAHVACAHAQVKPDVARQQLLRLELTRLGR
eukprot:5674734-Prymnesium_polylepis.1